MGGNVFANYDADKNKFDIITGKQLAARNIAIEECTLLGQCLKQLSSDLAPHLQGIVDGLVAEALSDEEANVYRLDRGDEVKAIPFMVFKSREVKRSPVREGCLCLRRTR